MILLECQDHTIVSKLG